ncbi:MAG: F0F1 ATP synthase subunit alpha [Planctomycetota bacterium]|nr:F0F1 ATP synthase subunit alpha [Planctomycetota bacterium]
MRFNPEEITSVIRAELEKFESEVDVSEVGTVLSVGDGIARIYGLEKASAGEMLEFENGVRAQVFNLEAGSIGAVVLGEDRELHEGMTIRRTGKLLQVPVGKGLAGRVVDALGNPIDGKGPIDAETTRPVEMIAPGIAGRQPVTQPLQTGIKAIDAMTPIGRGQRELIIGDRKTGKTAIAVDTIINQKSENVHCFYVAIGQKDSTVAGVVEDLRRNGALDYTTVIVASASAPAPLQYIAPYSGCAMAEHLMYNHGAHTLVVYDDLSKQATAYRQLSLLLRRPPGREAYPGDVFYLHSRLLERAVKLSDELGAGSLTALPIIETQEGEVSAYIPTNVISITDGQIYLQPDLFRANIRPAIDVGISVSRVGGAAQVKAMKHKKVANGLRLNLAAFRELEAFAQLGTDLDAGTQAQIDRGVRMVEILKQPQFQPMHVIDQVTSIFAAASGHLDKVPVARVAEYESKLLAYMRDSHAPFRDKLLSTKVLDAEAETEFNRICAQFTEAFLAGKAPDPR